MTEAEPDREEEDRRSELRDAAKAESERLQQGSTVSLLGASVPVRVLLAFGVFVVVFMVVWTALWALGGGAGLGLGWIPAAAAGVLAIRLVGRGAPTA